MYAITALFALYVAVTHGYALLRWRRGEGDGWYLGFFLIWNIAAAIVLVAVAQIWLREYGRGAAPVTLIAVATAPHVIVLAGNFANTVSAMRAGTKGWSLALLISWIVVSILTIVLLGVVSPNTWLIRVLS